MQLYWLESKVFFFFFFSFNSPKNSFKHLIWLWKVPCWPLKHPTHCKMVFGLTYNHLKSRKREYLMRLENGITRNLQLAIAGCGVSLPGWRMSSVVFQQIRECIHLNGVTALLWGLDKLWPMAFSLQIKILGAQPCLVTCVWSMAAYMAKLSDCNRDHMACKAQIAANLTFYRRKFVNLSLL